MINDLNPSAHPKSPVAKILVIEDETNIAAAIQRCIESAGHTCHIAPEFPTDQSPLHPDADRPVK
jgi:hypothetical protein